MRRSLRLYPGAAARQVSRRSGHHLSFLGLYSQAHPQVNLHHPPGQLHPHFAATGLAGQQSIPLWQSANLGTASLFQGGRSVLMPQCRGAMAGWQFRSSWWVETRRILGECHAGLQPAPVMLGPSTDIAP